MELEYQMTVAPPGQGVPFRQVFHEGAWLNKDGTVLTGASTPARVQLLSGGRSVMQWAANAAATVQAAFDTSIDSNYAVTRGSTPRIASVADTTALSDDPLKFKAIIRRQRNAADSAAWSARATILWGRLGTDTAWNTLSTNPTASIAAIAADNTADLTGFGVLTFDIGARLRAEGKRIYPGDAIRILLGPDAANANSVMQVAQSWLEYPRHNCFQSMSDRGIIQL